ncbi:NAD-dependent epimerase/dehydratase family protein [Shimia biformata]|uniref:NAD-dependent epimerase/dehydratase family protein n=1 Tax=Shimia biformata TaxID=1294299 RepID=UPI00194F8B69|nr:NAD-dependent epimerase/dehydratase family protein [Shimia biformata]
MTGRIAITGASGFIGAEILRLGLEQGRNCHAILRSDRGVRREGVRVSMVDLSAPDAEPALIDALSDVETLIHVAASLSGDWATQQADTIAASEAVIAAVTKAGVRRVVLLSTIAVYDVTGLPNGGAVTEDSPLESHPARRDVYARAKLTQEAMFRDAATAGAFELVVLRPGAVYGPDRLMNAHIGPAIGPLLIRLGAGGEVPLAHVATCAQAALAAADLPLSARWEAINVVDDDLPDRRQFVDALRRCGWPRFVLALPRAVLTWPAHLLPDHPSLPGLLRPAIQAARLKPLTYSNKRLHQRLGAVTLMPFDRGMRQSIEHSGKAVK